ncbi:MAG: (2Fe-2S)-binding protein [Gammaproteobacteria bacterium]|nr:(2Fe-2S)-binding protein [Gammaproteobacteria bacterium]
MIAFNLNGQPVTTEAEPDTPLLWVIRDEFKLKGTKFGCGIARCGACTVHLGGTAVRSCSIPVAAAAGNDITTIEGLAPGNDHPLQRAWIAEQVPACGYCQSGQIMTAASFLANNADPSDAEIVEAMDANLCRCMSYIRIKRAIKSAARILREEA